MAEVNAPGSTEIAPAPRASNLREFWYYFSENKGAVAGLCVIVVVVLAAVFAEIVAPHGAAEQYRDHFLTPPFWEQGGTIEFPLGTDAVGRDILSRIIHGARYSLFIGLIVVSLSLSVGICLGLVAGFFRGWTDNVIMWLINVVWSIPTILLAMAIRFAIGDKINSFLAIFIAVGLSMWVEVARIVRGQVLGVREMEYVQAARAMGAGHWRILRHHILPNCMAPLIVQLTFVFAYAILSEAVLRFLGLAPARCR